MVDGDDGRLCFSRGELGVVRRPVVVRKEMEMEKKEKRRMWGKQHQHATSTL